VSAGHATETADAYSETAVTQGVKSSY